MAENGAAAQAQTEGSAQEGAADGFKAITSQEEFDRLIGHRMAEERAKFKDYNDLKSKAAEYDKLTEESKSELEKLREKAEKAEARAKTLEQDRQLADWKQEVSTATGVPADVLSGATKEELEAHAAKLNALIPKKEDGKQPGSVAPVVPGIGQATGAAKSGTAQQFSDAVGALL